jgi:hypothetical protein
LRLRADLAAQAEAVFSRQHHVEDEKVDAMVGHRSHHFASSLPVTKTLIAVISEATGSRSNCRETKA